MEPSLFQLWFDGDPLLHESAIMTGIKAFSGSRGDECLYPMLGKFDHELSLDEHCKDLILHFQCQRAEPLLRLGSVRRWRHVRKPSAFLANHSKALFSSKQWITH